MPFAPPSPRPSAPRRRGTAGARSSVGSLSRTTAAALMAKVSHR
jgi:hypothetical protein